MLDEARRLYSDGWSYRHLAFASEHYGSAEHRSSGYAQRRDSVADHESGARNPDAVSRLSVLPERRHGARQWAAAAG